MKIAIIGAKLQGVEAAYLAGKTGWEATLFDRNPEAPAAGLGHKVIVSDLTSLAAMEPLFAPFDLIVPALENETVLRLLHRYAQQKARPVLFDFDAYALTASKIDSNALLDDMALPLPVAYPECDFPVIAKPSQGSGSHGVRIIANADELRSHQKGSRGDQVIQAFVDGPSYSLEVLGTPGHYTPLLVTELEMDPAFDCKRVVAPADLPGNLVADFGHIGVSIAERLALKGIMDIEVIRDGNLLRILEIDARLPSQTPVSVHAATGINMLTVMADAALHPESTPISMPASHLAVILEHIQVRGKSLTVRGESIMASGGPLHLESNFFGADEAITSYSADRTNWVATLIITAADRPAAREKRNAVIDHILARFEIDRYMDPFPVVNSS